MRFAKDEWFVRPMNLFDSLFDVEFRRKQLVPGATVPRKFAVPEETALLSALRDVAAGSAVPPYDHARRFSHVCCGEYCASLGWVRDRTGYPYDAIDTASGLPLGRRCRLFFSGLRQSRPPRTGREPPDASGSYRPGRIPTTTIAMLAHCAAELKFLHPRCPVT